MNRPAAVRARALGLVFLVVVLLLLAILIWRQWTSLGEMGRDLRDFAWALRPGWLSLALGLATLNLALLGLVWAKLFRAGGGHIGWADGIRAWFVTNLGRYIPGKIWQLAGLTVYVRRRGGSGAVALSSALAFQMLTLVTGCALAVGALGGRALGSAERFPLPAIAVAAVLVIFLHPAAMHVLARLAARWLDEEPAAVQRLRGRDLGAAGAGMVVAWIVYGVGLWALVRGVGAAPPSVAVCTGVFAASYVIGYLSLVTPGGLVVREGALAGLLAALTPLPLAVTAALAVVARLWITASEVVMVLLVGLVPVGESNA